MYVKLKADFNCDLNIHLNILCNNTTAYDICWYNHFYREANVVYSLIT